VIAPIAAEGEKKSDAVASYAGSTVGTTATAEDVEAEFEAATKKSKELS
jgi:hypothetical protein